MMVVVIILIMAYRRRPYNKFDQNSSYIYFLLEKSHETLKRNSLPPEKETY